MKKKLNDDSTIIAIVAVALAALALLITAMKLLHTSIAKVMRDTVSSRSGQSYLGGTKALFGKKRAKGETYFQVVNSHDVVVAIALHFSHRQSLDASTKEDHPRNTSTAMWGTIHFKPSLSTLLDVLAHCHTDITHMRTRPPPFFSSWPAPTTTKPGKIHVENFDGVGDDSTPLASPIKRYDRDSSPKKARRQEQDDSTESDGFLAESHDKPANGNRASPKRGSVGSPSRSRSPRRQITRPDQDEDDSYREERASDTNNDGRAKNRSVAASPRSRNRRGRGGGGKGGEENGDESHADAARVAPRSDRDNSLSSSGSGGELDGKRWQTSVSGRSPPTGGTRTHKSVREPGRSRETSPKAARKEKEKDNDYEDEGEDGEGDNGASPRHRKAGRRGDWESQVARSSAMQSQPRRRKPNADKDKDRHKQGRSRGRRRDRDDDEDEGDDQG